MSRRWIFWLWLALPAWANAESWMALTLYPGGSVYQQAHLQALVPATQGLWHVTDYNGDVPLGAIDAMATTNAIAIQRDDVRFRRLIESRELTPKGLVNLRRLVEEHPLLGRRLITEDGEGTHFWFQLTRLYPPERQAMLLEQYSQALAAAFGDHCRVRSGGNGPLVGLQRLEWQWSAERSVDRAATLQSLAERQRALADRVMMSYSAADVLRYMRQALGGEPGLPASDAEVAQLYMIAESLRSRDLQALARPDFQRLNMVALGRSDLSSASSAMPLEGYRLDSNHHWQVAEHNYRVVDCR